MADQDGGVCCGLELNPDITGIGVRAALYAQILLGWVMSLWWPDTFAKNARTAYMTATALIIASFIQLQTQDSGLSLLDGIVVSLITSMMITFTIASKPPAPKAGTPNEDEEKSYSRGPMQFCFIAFWASWCFNLWRDPAHFGLKGKRAGCDTNYGVTLAVFGREIHATDPRMRTAALVLLSLGLVIAVIALFRSLEQVMSPILNLFEKKDSTGTRKPLYDNPILQTTHTILQCLAFGTLIYLVASTEKTILKNDLERETAEWSYGQTIALILLLQQVMDVFSTWVEKREAGGDSPNGKTSDPSLPMHVLTSTQAPQPGLGSSSAANPPQAAASTLQPTTSSSQPPETSPQHATNLSAPTPGASGSGRVSPTPSQIAAAQASDPS